MRFKIGDIIELRHNEGFAAKRGATAIVEKYYDGIIRIKWIRDNLSGMQHDGGYDERNFILKHRKINEVYGIVKFMKRIEKI